MGTGAGKIIREYGDVFAVIMPEIEPCIGFLQNNPAHYLDVWGHTAAAVDNAPYDFIVRLALLLHDIGKPEKYFVGDNGVGHFYGHPAVSRDLAEQILIRLRCDKRTQNQVLTLVEHHDDAFPLSKRGIRRLAAKYGVDTLERLLDVHRADIYAHSPQWAERKIQNTNNARQMFKEILSEDSCLSIKQLAIGGRDITSMGVSPGPQVGQMLNMLLEAVIDEKTPNTKQDLIEYLTKYLKSE
jgi:tRNA nucleotidyltransferase (CCA-adding enzyme)